MILSTIRRRGGGGRGRGRGGRGEKRERRRERRERGGTKIGGEFIKKAEAFYKTFHTYEKGTASDQVIEEIESWRNTKGKKKDR